MPGQASLDIPIHIKWSFSLRISSVNVTKSVGNYEFGQIYWRILKQKISFFYVVLWEQNLRNTWPGLYQTVNKNAIKFQPLKRVRI